MLQMCLYRGLLFFCFDSKNQKLSTIYRKLSRERAHRQSKHCSIPCSLRQLPSAFKAHPEATIDVPGGEREGARTGLTLSGGPETVLSGASQGYTRGAGAALRCLFSTPGWMRTLLPPQSLGDGGDTPGHPQPSAGLVVAPPAAPSPS